MKTPQIRRGLIALIVAGSCALPSAAVLADGHSFRLPLPPLPGINLPLPPPPPMVWMPHLHIYVAHKTQRPIFFREGHYYVRDNDRWFVSDDYNGPWEHVDEDRLPRTLRGYHHEDWDRYQRDADEHYRRRDEGDAPAAFYPGRYDHDRYAHDHGEHDRGEHRGRDHDRRDGYRSDDRRDDRGRDDHRRDDRGGDGDN